VCKRVVFKTGIGVVTTTSPRFLENPTGFQCARELCSRLWYWCGHDNITPVLRKPHWLPVHKGVVFKTVVLVWKCLNSTAPGYLSELCIPVASASGHWHLGSASTSLLQVPRAQITIGWQSFTVAGPSLWNSLPAALWRPEMTLHTFKRQLKA